MGRFRRMAAEFAKFTLLFTAAVYTLALPFYYTMVAEPSGTADALMPLEVVICIFVSVFLFAWSGKEVLEIFANFYRAR